MTTLPEVWVLTAFSILVLVLLLSVAVNDWVERGLKRRRERLRGTR